MRDTPHWWDWPFELGEHVVDQMPVRGFTETDVWEMIEEAHNWRPSHVPGRVVLETTKDRMNWHVIVEPDEQAKTVLVVTAYKVDPL